MGSDEEDMMKNPLKRSFDDMNSKPEIASAAMDVDKDRSFISGDDQVKILEVARRENTIVVLEAGVEKTMIVEMMINEFGQSLGNNGVNKIIIYLAPSVNLVQQQCKVIKSLTTLRVDEIFGAKGVDDWRRETWEDLINAHDILVMTPQILLDALRKDILTLDIVILMILDECQLATGKHPYAKIMKDFYHDKCRIKPIVFGITASPINRTGVTPARDCKRKISDLENLLDSRIYTAENKVELESYVPSVKEVCLYESPVSPTSKLKKKFISSPSKDTRNHFSVTSTVTLTDFGLVRAHTTKEMEVYRVEATGVSVSADSSVSFLENYCEKLPRDKIFTPKPTYQFLLEGQYYRCKLTLPPNAALQTVVGPTTSGSYLSKQLVCLEACKRLHQVGALTDYLTPSEEASKAVPCPTSKTVSAGAGTTKRKELHGTTRIHLLSGTWGDNVDGFSFQAYKMDFICNVEEHRYSSFVLLLQSKLDDDVGNIQVDLYLLSKFVKSSVSACGQMFLDGEQVRKAKCFQEFFFNGLFGKLFVNTSGERKLLFETHETLWDPSRMYILLPLEASTSCTNSWEINWRGIESCVAVVAFLKKHAWLNAELSESRRKMLLIDRPEPDGFNVESTNIIHLANKSVCLNELANMVVVSIHTGRIYSIMEAVENSSAESPFDGSSESESPSYSSYTDYFSKKYGIMLVHPGQPLLLLKQSHNAHNLLVDFRNEHITNGKMSPNDNRVVTAKPRYYAYMPPELLIGIDIGTSVLKSFYLLPSLMHRLESLMLASQLRKDLVLCSDNLRISSSLILEALTTLKCSEIFSMERLELLGDSVLKYAVSCHLFLKYPKKHEGQLSSERQRIICNSALHQLGTQRKLQGYIRDGAFEPRRWTAPGQRSLWPCACVHGVDSVEVPLDEKFVTEDMKVKVGKSCDRGHRWMGSKTISDCVEALIGACYVGGGLIAALDLMKWIGIDAATDPALVQEAIEIASLHLYVPKFKDIEILEGKLGYEFRVKGILLEAITHATEQEQDASFCYQRLEFLGDSVLDVLVTRHLYHNHSEIDPGELTDLRSASVNNDSFALAAVKKKLYIHLQHCSGHLEDQISAYVKSVSESCDSTKPVQVTDAPKVLGDLMESIAGAILIDTNLNLDEVWRIFEPLLSPIVTPDKLELRPLRELIELCSSLGYFLKEKYIIKGDEVKAELSLQLEDILLVEKGSGKSKKAGRGQAALHLLKRLEERGISNSKRSKDGTEDVCDPYSLRSGGDVCDHVNTEPTQGPCKRQKKSNLPEEPDRNPLSTTDSKDIPVIPPVDMKKGGPRNSLFALCKRQQWPMPTFDCTEQKSRTAVVFGEGSEQRTGFNSYESKITLIIPNSGTIVVSGKPQPDKKTSSDSAALTMLLELQAQKKIVISQHCRRNSNSKHKNKSSFPAKSVERRVINSINCYSANPMALMGEADKQIPDPPHVLIFPFPLQGHVNSMLKLAEFLCLSGGITVTYLVPQHIHRRLLLHANIESRFNKYPGFSLLSLPDGIFDGEMSTAGAAYKLYDSLNSVAVPFLRDLLTPKSDWAQTKNPITTIIADGAYSMVIDIALQIGVPIIYFRTISACAFWAYFSAPELTEAGEIPFSENEMDLGITSVKGMEGYIRRRDLPSFFRDIEGPDFKMLATETRQTTKTNGLILNTFDDLEGPILSQIRTQCPNLYTIGPLHAHLKSKLTENSKSTTTKSSSNSLWAEDRKCIEWLDQQPSKSVLYVSFGSIAVVKNEQLIELWQGLVNSGVKFLWVIRPDSIIIDQKNDDGDEEGNNNKKSIREELEVATKERGFMVGWAPQEEVLGHPAVGGFWTHSGWNSTLETVVEGVPMICWPFFADQQINSRFVDEVWKIGLDMKDKCDKVVVENMIKDLMVVRKDGFLKRAEEVAKLARKSIEKDGSSFRNLERLIRDVRLKSLSLKC
ncbi:OLC1v1030287C1 [Oldenlandia corymbosa var. corymbosa]|uniref:OLC1v1030287C1 n=1 Tax=Oldenlandia corymbosa var. corymbosa TaxID=529605 RepID=A0AAV1CFS7_OLDCO|nr:OLC1v1030287C1 [Oldenlandia corymbosa var. corymbosa]